MCKVRYCVLPAGAVVQRGLHNSSCGVRRRSPDIGVCELRKAHDVNKISRTIGLVVGGLLTLLMFAAVPASAAEPPANPQVPSGANKAAAAPDLCQHWSQLRAAQGEQRYRNLNNVPFTYTNGVYGANWFNVACGDLSFTVARGQEALVDLTAAAELDCQGPTAGNSWCGGRFLINGLPLARPDNSGRGDTFAWDSANGGAFDWQANVLDMSYRAMCPREDNVTTPCTYRVQLQSRLENSATSVWIDDLKMSVDVFEGAVMVVNAPATP